MPQGLTNQMLGQLLRDLGFESGDVTEKNHVVWRHPQSGCTLLLPANKALQSVRPADVVGIKAQLDQQGHLEEAAFEVFVAEGELPVR